MGKKGGRRRSLEEFGRGLTEPSLPALLVALATTAVLALSSGLLLDEERAAAGLLGYLPESSHDYYLATTRRALLRDGLPSSTTGLVVMGGSATRESLPRDFALQSALFGTGQSGRAWILGGGALTTWEMRAIAERLPQDFRGVVVLGVNPLRLSSSDEDLKGLLRAPRLGFRSSALDAEAGILGLSPLPRRGIYLWDNRHFLIPRFPRLMGNLIHGPPPAEPHRFDTARGKKPIAKRRMRGIRGGLRQYDRNSASHREVLARTIADLRTRPQVEVVLLESPVRPRGFVKGGVAKAYRKHRLAMEAFAEAQGVAYWRLDEEAGLTAESFVDAFHVGSGEARRRYGEALSARLGAETSLPRGDGT